MTETYNNITHSLNDNIGDKGGVRVPGNADGGGGGEHGEVHGQ